MRKLLGLICLIFVIASISLYAVTLVYPAGSRSHHSLELEKYVYPRYCEEMDAGELAEEVERKLGYHLKADFEGDDVDGYVTVGSDEVVIVMPKLNPAQKHILDDIVREHISYRLRGLLDKLKEEKNLSKVKTFAYLYPRGNLSLNVLKNLWGAIKPKVDISGLNLHNSTHIAIITTRKLILQEREYIDKVISDALGKEVSGVEVTLSPRDPPSNVYGVSATDLVSTTSTTWVDLPDMKFSYRYINNWDRIYRSPRFSFS